MVCAPGAVGAADDDAPVISSKAATAATTVSDLTHKLAQRRTVPIKNPPQRSPTPAFLVAAGRGEKVRRERTCQQKRPERNIICAVYASAHVTRISAIRDGLDLAGGDRCGFTSGFAGSCAFSARYGTPAT